MLKKYYLVVLPFLILIVYDYYRNKERLSVLSGNNGHFTVAKIYNTFEIDGSRYFNCIYKVDSSYYTEVAQGENIIYVGDSIIPQSFLLVYSKSDKKINTIIWSHKLAANSPLGLNLDSIKLDEGSLSKNIFTLFSTNSNADENNQAEVNRFLKTNVEDLK